MREIVDINSWERNKPYNFFSKFDNPYASVVSILNVDNIVNIAKQNEMSFYGIMSFLVLKTLNEIDDFRYVLENDKVYKYEQINMSCSVLTVNNQLNFTRIIEYNDFDKFIDDFMKAKVEAENEEKIPYVECYNKVYITCVPWMRITSLENPMNYLVKDSVPRICWGKYFLQENQYYIDMSLQVNHAFQDGYHIGLFYNKLQENILNFGLVKNEEKRLVYRLR